MGLDKGSVDEALAAPTVCGTPYHGLVQDGTLVLPNAVAMAYDQPASGQYGAAAGDTHLVEVPGTPEVVRTAEEQAQDAALGHQWRRTAVLSGSDQQLYGKPLGGWIYIDPNGARWRVTRTGPGLVSWSAVPVAFTITLTRFGDVRESGLPAQSYTHTITVADWQQTYTGPQGACGMWMDRGVLYLHAITRHGNKAAFAMCNGTDVFNYLNAGGGEIDNVHLGAYVPMGWFEIDIQGPGESATVTGAVIRSRAQTASWSEVDLDALEQHEIRYYRVIETEGSGFSNRVELDPAWDYSTGPAGVFEYQSQSQCIFRAGTRLLTQSVSAIIGLWPGEGEWVEVRRTIEVVHDKSAPLPTTIPAITDRLFTWTRELDTLNELRVRITVGGEVRSAIDLSVRWIGQVGYRVSPPSPQYELPYARESELNGEAWVEPIINYIESGPGWSDGPLPASFSAALVRSTPGGEAVPLLSDVGALLSGVGFYQWGRWAPPLWGVASAEMRLAQVRYANNLVGLSVIGCESFLNARPERLFLFPAASPTAAHGSVVESAYDKTQRYYGSWCPQTGQAVWGDTEPVCWV